MAAQDFNLTPGLGGMPRLELVAPDGARAEVYAHGAHVTSWIPAGGAERLFLSQRSVFDGQAAIRGGVPVIFPQFSMEGPLPRHGFARTRAWEFLGAALEAGGARGSFRLVDTPETRRIWPHAFTARLDVRTGGARLELTLAVENRGEEAFSFTVALHTYLRIADIGLAHVRGLAGVRYRDSAAGNVLRTQVEKRLAFLGEVDRIYFSPPGPLVVGDGSQHIRIVARGFPDAVVWNPGEARAAALADLEPEGYRHMLCVEAAAIESPIRLAPGASWAGSQALESSRA